MGGVGGVNPYGPWLLNIRSFFDAFPKENVGWFELHELGWVARFIFIHIDALAVILTESCGKVAFGW